MYLDTVLGIVELQGWRHLCHMKLCGCFMHNTVLPLACSNSLVPDSCSAAQTRFVCECCSALWSPSNNDKSYIWCCILQNWVSKETSQLHFGLIVQQQMLHGHFCRVCDITYMIGYWSVMTLSPHACRLFKRIWNIISIKYDKNFVHGIILSPDLRTKYRNKISTCFYMVRFGEGLHLCHAI